MSSLIEGKKGSKQLLLGNEAIVRGALEAGVNVAAGYPGTPASEIIQAFSTVGKERNLYVEWSVNEKVSMEVAAAASFAGLRALCAMKQNGVCVAADFLLHLALTGTRGGMVIVPCDDPGAISSINEGEARQFGRMMELPVLEPADIQETKEMTKWAFDLSEELRLPVLVRSVTRLSHSSGVVTNGDLPDTNGQARFDHHGPLFDQMAGPLQPAPASMTHMLQQQKIQKASAIFEESAFNTYTGPEKPEMVIITGSICTLYCHEAIDLLALEDRVGILKLGTTWPMPAGLVENYLRRADKIVVVEEIFPFLEDQVKILATELVNDIGAKTILGQRDGLFPTVGEMNPDLVAAGLAKAMGIEYQPGAGDYKERAQAAALTHAPHRDLTFCPGCPHRASFWTIRTAVEMDGRGGFVCGDIGCYSLAFLPTGYSALKTLHAMGSGTGVASGFGKLKQFGMDQPILSVCGDSTFFHTGMPPLINAVHNSADILMVILDNSGTAMTGFQPHPGLPVDAYKEEAPAIDIAAVCESIGAKVRISDPFNVEQTRNTLLEIMEEKGPRVLILKQMCALSPEKKGKKQFEVSVDQDVCLGESCGCNRLCTRIFRCPGLVWNKEKKKAEVDEVICAGCGVCASICPNDAIQRKEVA